jgi:hypothetical protein
MGSIRDFVNSVKTAFSVTPPAAEKQLVPDGVYDRVGVPGDELTVKGGKVTEIRKGGDSIAPGDALQGLILQGVADMVESGEIQYRATEKLRDGVYRNTATGLTDQYITVRDSKPLGVTHRQDDGCPSTQVFSAEVSDYWTTVLPLYVAHGLAEWEVETCGHDYQEAFPYMKC